MIRLAALLLLPCRMSEPHLKAAEEEDEEEREEEDEVLVGGKTSDSGNLKAKL